MEQVIRALSGAGENHQLIDSMIERHIIAVRDDVEILATRCNAIDGELARTFARKYQELPAHARLHFLLSPLTFSTTRQREAGAEVSIGALLALLDSELSLAYGKPIGRFAGAAEIWSSIGDSVLRRTADDRWEHIAAPRLDSLVALDFESPIAREIIPSSAIMYAPPEDFTDTERQSVIDKLSRAFAYVDAVHPKFGRIIRNYVRAIRLRKRSANMTSAEHAGAMVGEIRLLNAQSEINTFQMLAESLVHESTHNFLSAHEYLEGSFVISHSQRYRPISPWTGNPIPVASFAHAVFVWYALLDFSIRELASADATGVSRLEIQKRSVRYLSGFLVATRLSDAIRNLGTFNDVILDAIDEVQAIVKRNVSLTTASLGAAVAC